MGESQYEQHSGLSQHQGKSKEPVHLNIVRGRAAVSLGNTKPEGTPIKNPKKIQNFKNTVKNNTLNSDHDRVSVGNRKKIRRKVRTEKKVSMTFFGNNVDGLATKMESLENILLQCPSAIFLQETKLGRPNRIKTPSSGKYTFYELHRTKNAPKGEKGGGIALGVLNSLEPSWISEGDDDCETITVEIWVAGFPIRLVCGYGPQDYDKNERKVKFWDYLNKEVDNASKDGAAFVLQMDGNLWAGEGIIKGDPKKQNQNGKLLEIFLLKNPHITVVNTLPQCDGLFTWIRHTKIGTKKSVLDFYLVCDQILPLITSMKIYENGGQSLTRYKGKVTRADHCMLELNINPMVHKEKKHERQPVFNVKNKLFQQKFSMFTTNTTMLTKCFSSTKENIDIQFKRWKRCFNKALHASVRIIRVKSDSEGKQSKMDILMEEKKQLLKRKVISLEEKQRIINIAEEITKECEDKEYNKLVKTLGQLESETGQTNNTNFWRQLRKSYPKKSKPLPTGIKNIKGKVVTHPDEKKKVTLKHVQHRMRKRPRKEEVKEILSTQEKLFEDRLKLAKEEKKC